MDKYNFSNLPEGDQIAADIFFSTLRDYEAEAVKSPKDKAYWINMIEKFKKANQHLLPYYDSWKALGEINQMNKAVK